MLSGPGLLKKEVEAPMLTVTAAGSSAPSPRGPDPEPSGTEAALRAELDTLNASLRELKSTNFGVRAYVEAWFAFVAGSVGAKMLYDWQVTHGKPPLVAFPILLLGLSLGADAVAQRLAQRRLARDEEGRIRRQRELREKLGLEDAPVPPMSSQPRAAVA